MDPFVAQVQTNYLKDKLERIENSEPDDALVNSLKEILRNQVPTAWKDYEDLYRTAMACVSQINLFHPELMGRRSDKGSLLVAATEFAQQATMICRIPGVVDSNKLEEFVVEVAEITGVTADYYDKEYSTLQDEVMKTDPKQLYVNEMRALCIDFLDDDFKHHTYKNEKPSSGNIDTARLYRELAAYKTQLPVEYASSIVVRVSSKNLHLVKACIIGPEGTPYHNGVFFFDIFLHNYPHEPPKVNFLTTSGGKYRQNPNLYHGGKVCLSLLGTWQGEPWQPNKSTLLQVLVSIQSLIFVNDPYFNEPGYDKGRGTPQGDQESAQYNLNLYHQVADAAILQPLQRRAKVVPPEFDLAVSTHFIHKRQEIEFTVGGWAEEANSKDTAAQKHKDLPMNELLKEISECLEALARRSHHRS